MTKPTLDLFPEPSPLSTPPVWEDIERLAMHYPSAHAVVTLVEHGDITREQGLIALVHWFAAGFSRQFQRELDASRREVLDTIVQEKCGCSTSSYIRRRMVKMSCASHQAEDAVDPHAGSTGKPSTRD